MLNAYYVLRPLYMLWMKRFKRCDLCVKRISTTRVQASKQTHRKGIQIRSGPEFSAPDRQDETVNPGTSEYEGILKHSL